MTDDDTNADRPLSTQTAAPPLGPPRRPIVGLAMADDDMAYLRERSAHVQRELLALLERFNR